MRKFKVNKLFSSSWGNSKLSKLANETSKTHTFTYSSPRSDDDLMTDQKATNLKDLSSGAVLNLATHTIHQFRNLPVMTQFNEQHILNKRLNIIFGYYKNLVLDSRSSLEFISETENEEEEEPKNRQLE